ncbi:MAG: hypothetical protein BGO43_00955 [Gammaproteobacteria bacterium 39-13]|nr:hypothetical protein [Gammaproteobacteria bacterium]OJV86933.1 MAG: hypothetical protein BGO43_00955 [Gammaproteobacteria bacterium 39-13]
MEKFIEIADESGAIKKYLRDILGKFKGEDDVEQDYLSALNYDIGVINRLLDRSPSQIEMHQKSYLLQEEYNKSLEIAKSRWERGDKGFQIGASAVKDLVAHKKSYEKGLDDLHAYELKQKNIDSYSNPNSQDNPGSPWQQLGALANRLDKNDFDDVGATLRRFAIKLDAKDKGNRQEILRKVLSKNKIKLDKNFKAAFIEQSRRENDPKTHQLIEELVTFVGTRADRLENLRIDWQSQGILAKYNANDLIMIKREFDNFESFLNYIEENLTQNGNICKKIKDNIANNKRILTRYREKLNSAIGWKIQAASHASNLRCDDNFYGLIKELNNHIFNLDDKEDYEEISPLLEIPRAVLSLNMNFDRYIFLLKVLRRTNASAALKKWQASRWISNSDNLNLLQVKSVNNYLIPLKLIPFVPQRTGFLPDSWIRYWFFRTQEQLSVFWQWVKKGLVGKYEETATLLNETYRQVDYFEKMIRVNRSLGKGMDLTYIGEHSAFQSALSLPTYLAREKNRGDAVRPSWTVGSLLKWIPFFNRFKTYTFFSLWREELYDAERAVKKKCKEIAKYFTEDFETLLLNSISSQSFMFPGNLMDDLKKFIVTYADKVDADKFKEMSNPVNILQKFDFLLPAKGNEIYRHINEDAVIGFLHFAEKYYTSSQIEAIKIIAKIILREDIPSIPDQEKWLMKKVACLLPANNKQGSFEKLMDLIATKYVFATGDDGNEAAFNFVKRFSPRAASTWQSLREESLEQKFILLNNILSVKIGKEKDIMGNEVYDTQGYQLRYKNYANYIRDVIASDKLNHTQYKKSLLAQAKKYVDAYKGHSIAYADFLMGLCLDDNLDILEVYCRKRFTNLLAHNAPNAMSALDHQFYTLITKNPRLIAVVLQQVSRSYNGDNMDLAEVILTLNEPEITALYFAKRVEYLIHQRSFAALVQEKKTYAEFLKNPHFSKYLHQVIAEYLDELIHEEDWQTLELPSFCHVLEIYATQRNKETYRLLRIKRLLEKNDSDATEHYLSILNDYLPAKLESDLITLPKGKQFLIEIFENHAKALTLQKKWEGNFQFFIKFFLPSGNKSLLYDIRLKWLESFLFAPEKFSFSDSAMYSSLDEKLHCENKEIPNDETSLSAFYGEANLPKVRALLMRRLREFNENLDDAVIRLLLNYSRDNSFNLDKQWPLMHKKLEKYQIGQKIMHCFKNGAFVEAIKMLEQFIVELKGLEIINERSKQDTRTKVIDYEKKLSSELLSALYDQFKDTIINVSVLKKSETLQYASSLRALSSLRLDLYQKIVDSDLPAEVKETIEEIQSKSNAMLKKIEQFMSTLSLANLHRIVFDDEMIDILNFLPKNTSNYILTQLKALKACLSEEDPLFSSLDAFIRLVANEYEHPKFRQNDLKSINTFKATKQNYPEIATNMASKLIYALEKNEALIEHPLFKQSHNSYQNIFLHHLTPDLQEKLIKTLKQRIERLLLEIEGNEGFKRTEWICYGKLYRWMLQLNPASAENVKRDVKDWMKNCMNEIQKIHLSLTKKFDSVLEKKDSIVHDNVDYKPSREVIEEEYRLIKMSLFVRTFADDKETKDLDRLLSSIAKRQRRAMINGLSGAFIEHCLDVANKLLTLAGSEQQREACIHLMETWNQYRYSSKSEVRFLAISNSIPQYIEEFENTIFLYFIKKHNLSDNFTSLMLSKIKQWGLMEELVDPAELLKSHPLTEFREILREEAKNKPHSFFYSKPDERDARKLFVSFCLTIQAHQLARLWEKRRNDAPLTFRQFKPQDISDPLSAMVNRLAKKFDIGHGEYNRSVLSAISKDADYFASWAASLPKERDAKQKKEQANKRKEGSAL